MQRVEVHVRHLRLFHLWAMVAWAVLAVPTVLVWHDSVLFVGLISVYANFVGHWSAWQAARSEEATPTPGESV